MTFDRKDALELFDRKTKESIQRRRPQLEMVEQAAVKASLLTGDPNWDIFLQQIQAVIERTEQQREKLMEQVQNPALVDANEVAQVRNAVMACNERIGTLNAVIAMPSDLIKHGEGARSLLDRLENEQENGTAA